MMKRIDCVDGDTWHEIIGRWLGDDNLRRSTSILKKKKNWILEKGDPREITFDSAGTKPYYIKTLEIETKPPKIEEKSQLINNKCIDN
uniref:F-box domain-containing protein n=1 Tax=Caenorhabditis tropicalis TaxID=1561998 RepID=A0A1I7UQG4_9PELO